jgi:hypothetical protein
MLTGPEARSMRLVRGAIERVGLDLRGHTVLTEAASGHYALTPLIAALAGAEKVYCVGRDTRYGSAHEVAHELRNRCAMWGASNRIDLPLDRASTPLADVDIVTNLGHVRPIDRPLLTRLKQGAVVALMWETWEFRAADVDLVACRELRIPLLGTNEHHVDLDTMGYIGPVAIKLLFSAGIEVRRSRIIVAGTGEFANIAAKALAANGADVISIDVGDVGSLASALDVLQPADALLVVDHHSGRDLIGDSGELSAAAIAAANPCLAVIHICGGVDRTALARHGLTVAPQEFASSGYMSVATDYVGPRPLIDLHTAGLKVGQAMRQATARGLHGLDAEKWALRNCPHAQGFPDRHGSPGEPSG